jgi:hypothetical protein
MSGLAQMLAGRKRDSPVWEYFSGICGKNLFFVWNSECSAQKSYAEINGNASFREAKQTYFYCHFMSLL